MLYARLLNNDLSCINLPLEFEMETLDFDDEWGQFAEFCVELFKKCSSDQLLRSQLDLINQFDSYSQASGSKSGIEFLLRDEHIFRCLNIELDMIYSKTDLTNRQPVSTKIQFICFNP